jgi:electron transfer flavoprotein alpha subunit
MSRILIIAEHDGQTLNPATAKAVTAASAMQAEIDVLVMAAEVDAVAAQAAAIQGVHTVRTLADARFGHPLAAQIAPEVVAVAAGYSHVLLASTTFGRDLAPRVAALLGVNQVSDIMAVLGPRQFKRPIYAGNAIVTVSVPEASVVVGTIRCASFAAAGDGGVAAIEALSVQSNDPGHSRFVSMAGGGGDGPDLSSASVVVSGGRALNSAENFALIRSLADKLGAAVGASRAAVDAGYVPNELQVGQTGKIIAPDLYFAIGISGAIQHLTGIKDAGTIVAINKDADAPIFEIADLGLVGDLFEIVPALERALEG